MWQSNNQLRQFTPSFQNIDNTVQRHKSNQKHLELAPWNYSQHITPDDYIKAKSKSIGKTLQYTFNYGGRNVRQNNCLKGQKQLNEKLKYKYKSKQKNIEKERQKHKSIVQIQDANKFYNFQPSAKPFVFVNDILQKRKILIDKQKQTRKKINKSDKKSKLPRITGKHMEREDLKKTSYGTKLVNFFKTKKNTEGIPDFINTLGIPWNKYKIKEGQKIVEKIVKMMAVKE